MSNADSNGVHPYSAIPLPSGAPFELKATTDGKGWGAFATRPIKKYDVILKELPLFVIESTKVFPGSDDLNNAFANLPPLEKGLVELARDNGGPQFTSSALWFIQNSFDVSQTELGFFLVQSRFNHSCQPNSAVPFTERKDNGLAYLNRVALVDIEVGEEITFCYQPNLVTKTKAERHYQLRFECRCKCCTLNPAASRMSDMRRDLMATLDYISFGALSNGEIDESDNPLVSDPILKKAAEERTLPITTQLYYHIYHVALAEEEQVAAGHLLSTLRRNIFHLARSLRTESNVVIAALALKQDTYQKKREVAKLFYGLPDAGDNALNEEVSQMRAARIQGYLENNS